MADELIKKELTKESFYIRSLSLYLQGQEDIKLRILTYFNILQNIKTNTDTLFNILNIWDENYFEKTGIDSSAFENVWLDEIGLIFGCYRQVVLINYQMDTSEKPIPDSTLYTLSNFNYLCYILATISKMAFDGQNETLLYFYNGSRLLHYSKYSTSEYNLNLMDNNIRENVITKLGIIYVCLNDSLECKVYFTKYKQIGDNVTRKLFLNGLLTIESMGIIYERILKSSDAVFYGRIQGNERQASVTTNAPFLYNFTTDVGISQTKTFSYYKDISVTYNFTQANGLNSISATSNFANIYIYSFEDQQERRFEYDSQNTCWNAYRGNISLTNISKSVFEDTYLGQTFSLTNATNNSIGQIQYKTSSTSNYIPIKADRYTFVSTGNNQLVIDVGYDYNSKPLMQVAFGNTAFNTEDESLPSDIGISLRFSNPLTVFYNPTGMIGGQRDEV
jgi:hypothetical protein